jgi:hypothetical protein
MEVRPNSEPLFQYEGESDEPQAQQALVKLNLTAVNELTD